MLRRSLLTLAIVVAAAAAVVAFDAGDDGETPVGSAGTDCDYSLEAGDDLAVFVAGLQEGETGCLREGVHETTDDLAIEEPGIVLTSHPGESAELAGRLWVKEGADDVVVENLRLDGSNDEALPSPTINADGVVFRGNDVTNDHTGICFVIGDDRFGQAEGTIIDGNLIHDCGELPATNHHHGIYVAHARGTEIKSNTIVGAADRGIQLYPDADGSKITGNLLLGNGQGLIFAGNETLTSDDNFVEGNVILASTNRFNVEASWPGDAGTGNVLRANCTWTASEEYEGEPAGSGIEPSITEIDKSGNIVEEPDDVDLDEGEIEFDDDGVCAIPPATP